MSTNPFEVIHGIYQLLALIRKVGGRRHYAIS